MKKIASEIILEIAAFKGKTEGFCKKTRHFEHGITMITTEIKSAFASKKVGRDIGRYVSFVFDDLLFFDVQGKNVLQKQITNAIKMFCENISKSIKKILVVGLGNDKYAADSLGKKSVERVVATKPYLSKKLFNDKQMKEVYTLLPGVFGTTGMETSQTIKSVCEFLQPDVVIAIDSMVASKTETLAKSIQISNTKLMPGGGVGNNRQEISKEVLGVDVLAIGVPLVVNLCSVFDCDEELIVSTKDVEQRVCVLSKIIATAINKSFCNLSKKEFDELTN